MYAEGDYWHPIIKAYPGYPYYMKKISGGSSFTVAGVHAADTLRWLAGEVVEVAAFSAGPIMNKEFEYPPVTVASLRFANGAIGKLSSVIEGETPYIFNMRLFGTTMSIDNNRIHSSKWYPGTLGYYEFPTVKPESGDVSHHPVRAGDQRTSWSASRTTWNRTPRSTTSARPWRFALRSMSRQPRAASRSRSSLTSPDGLPVSHKPLPEVVPAATPWSR